MPCQGMPGVGSGSKMVVGMHPELDCFSHVPVDVVKPGNRPPTTMATEAENRVTKLALEFWLQLFFLSQVHTHAKNLPGQPNGLPK